MFEMAFALSTLWECSVNPLGLDGGHVLGRLLWHALGSARLRVCDLTPNSGRGQFSGSCESRSWLS